MDEDSLRCSRYNGNRLKRCDDSSISTPFLPPSSFKVVGYEGNTEFPICPEEGYTPSGFVVLSHGSTSLPKSKGEGRPQFLFEKFTVNNKGPTPNR